MYKWIAVAIFVLSLAAATSAQETCTGECAEWRARALAAEKEVETLQETSAIRFCREITVFTLMLLDHLMEDSDGDIRFRQFEVGLPTGAELAVRILVEGLDLDDPGNTISEAEVASIYNIMILSMQGLQCGERLDWGGI